MGEEQKCDPLASAARDGLLFFPHYDVILCIYTEQATAKSYLFAKLFIKIT
jgi:hypothetical protein